MSKIQFGIDQISKKNIQQKFDGKIALLCHSASIDHALHHSAEIFQKVFGDRFVKIFGPQHGFVTDVQDNMVETKEFIHPYFKIPVHSLYGEVRKPTSEMLKGIDTFVIDLQDVGTRVYTYIQTMSYVLEACAESGVKVIVLDRPNPVGGNIIEGNILNSEFKSFVGLHPVPMRHSLTMGEMAKLINTYFLPSPGQLEVITLQNWNRDLFWKDLDRHWVLPSPNLPTSEGALTFVGSVLFEGTNISEGRGTTRSLEIIGHPNIEAFQFSQNFNKLLREHQIHGILARPQVFLPTFQKHQDVVCQGCQLHVQNFSQARPWSVGQLLCRELYHELGTDFKWNDQPYEYEFSGLAIDFINGDNRIRKWVEANGSLEELLHLEQENLQTFIEQKKSIQLY